MTKKGYSNSDADFIQLLIQLLEMYLTKILQVQLRICSDQYKPTLPVIQLGDYQFKVNKDGVGEWCFMITVFHSGDKSEKILINFPFNAAQTRLSVLCTACVSLMHRTDQTLIDTNLV